MIGNPACKDYYNSVNDLLSKGACSQDKISLPSSDSSVNISVSTFGLLTTISYALTCQKTSDNQGYCGASTKLNDSFVISLYVIAPLIPGFELPAIKDNKGLTDKQICTDCSKNGLATFLTNPNLSEQERSSVQKVSSDLDNHCGNSYTTVPGVGGVGDSSNAISGALSTVAILAAIFTQL